MKHLHIAAITASTLALMLLASPQAQAYTYNGLMWPEELLPLPVALFDSGVDNISVEELEAIVQSSFAEWNGVGCASIQLEYIGLTDEAVQVNENQVLQWVEDEEAWFYGSMTAGATIIDAFDNPDTPERERPQVDIAFNGINFTWIVGGAGPARIDRLDPEVVLTHEVGHMLGLSHTQPGLDNAATMAAAYVPDTTQTSLAIDDRQGLCELYWTEGSECDTDEDCREDETCVDYYSEANDTTVRLCQERRGDFGDDCNGSSLNCRGLCLLENADFSEGTCTDLCQVDTDCPCEWSCRNIRTVTQPLFVCREMLPDDGDHCAQGDEDDMPDAGNNDANNMTDGDDMDSMDAGMTPDADSGTGGNGGGKNKGCSTALPTSHPGTPLLPALALLGVALATTARRRKLAVAIACAAALVLTASSASADELNFEAGGAAGLLTHVVILEAPKSGNRDKKNIKAAIEARIASAGGYEIVDDRQLQRTLGNRNFRQMQRCADRDCYFDAVIDATIDRLVCVKSFRDGQYYYVDMEIDDAYERALIKYATTEGEGTRDLYYIDPAVDDMLRPDMPPPLPPGAGISVKPAPAKIDSDLQNEITDAGGGGNNRAPAPSGDDASLGPMAKYTLMGGGGLIALGGVFALLADNTQAEIQARPHDRATVEDLISTGETQQLGANVLFGLGAAAMITGGVLYFFFPEENSQNASNTHTPQNNDDLQWQINLAPTGAALEVRY